MMTVVIKNKTFQSSGLGVRNSVYYLYDTAIVERNTKKLQEVNKLVNRMKVLLKSWFGEASTPAKRVVATILAVAVIFALLETGARVFYRIPGAVMPNAYYMFQMIPNLTPEPGSSWDLSRPSITTNKDGFRATGITVKKPAGVLRILCLGDSVTFGDVPRRDNETYPYFLQWCLNWSYPGRTIQVINAGCLGHTSVQGLEMLKRKGLSYEPDILIVGFVHHEQLPALKTDLDQMNSAPSFVKLIKSLLYKSSFYLMLRGVFAPGTLSMSYLAGAPGQLTDNMVMRVPVDSYKKTLQEFIDIAAANKMTIIFLKIPTRNDGKRQMEEQHSFALREVVEKNRCHFIELDQAMSYYRADYEFTLMADEVHPNPQGNNLIAGIIDEYMKERGIITERLK